jgi:hypothetical protein
MRFYMAGVEPVARTSRSMTLIRGDMGALVNPSGRARTTRERESRIVPTFGEILADGSVIDLVSSATYNQLELLFWRKHRKTIAPQIECGDHVFQTPDLDPTLIKAMRFPRDAGDYGTNGKLFAQIRILFERHIGLTPAEASLMTAWVCSTWFQDCLSSPPTLMISGPETCRAISLFNLLSCLCRRSIILADLNRTGFLCLMPWQPTLLINLPSGSLKILDLWGTSNHRGVYVVGSQGRVHNVVGSKAVFLGMADAWCDEAVHLALPARQQVLPLDAHGQEEIANRLQPQLLMYRLRNFRRVRASRSAMQGASLPNSELVLNLTACVGSEPDILQAIAPILQRQDQDAQARRGCDVNMAILEVIWAPSHETKEIAVSRVTELTNALLRCRGEVLEYSPVEIGWKLRSLGLYRHRNGSGMVLRFSHQYSLIIHQLTQRFSLSLSPAPDCPYCVQPVAGVA